MIKSVYSKDTKVLTISLEGDLGIKNSEAIIEALRSLKFTANSIIISLRNIEKLDITTIQTLRAFRDYLSGRGLAVETKTDLPQEIDRLLTNTGFGKTL